MLTEVKAKSSDFMPRKKGQPWWRSHSEESTDEQGAPAAEALFAQFSKWQAGKGDMGSQTERSYSDVAGLDKRRNEEESEAEEDSDFELPQGGRGGG